jgi:hypothetical protein
VTLPFAVLRAGVLAILAFPPNPGGNLPASEFLGQTANDHPVRYFDAEISGGVNFEHLALRGAVVSLAPVGASGADTTNTDERGAFVFHRPLVQHQRYELTVRCQGFRTFSKVIDVAPAGRTEVIAAMELLPFFGDPNLPRKPTETTLCEVLKAPQEFSGKPIQFRAKIFALTSTRRFYMSSAGCSTEVHFAVSGDASLEASLKKQFFLVDSREIEATVVAGLLWTPAAPDHIQMMPVSVADVVQGQKSATIWVSGRLLDATGRPVRDQELYLGPPNPPVRSDNVGSVQHFSDSDGNFLIPAWVGTRGRATVVLEVAGGYHFTRKLTIVRGKNVNLGTVVVRPN